MDRRLIAIALAVIAGAAVGCGGGHGGGCTPAPKVEGRIDGDHLAIRWTVPSTPPSDCGPVALVIGAHTEPLGAAMPAILPDGGEIRVTTDHGTARIPLRFGRVPYGLYSSTMSRTSRSATVKTVIRP
jgi:hypothetical protein